MSQVLLPLTLIRINARTHTYIYTLSPSLSFSPRTHTHTHTYIHIHTHQQIFPRVFKQIAQESSSWSNLAHVSLSGQQAEQQIALLFGPGSTKSPGPAKNGCLALIKVCMWFMAENGLRE